MSPAIIEADLECESIAWLASNKRRGAGTGRIARPAFARFDAWSSVGWSQLEVDLVGGLASKRRVWAALVVPGKEEVEFPAKVCSALWNQNSASALVFHGPDEAFDHGDASVLPDSAISRADSLAATPALEVLAPEDTVPVADQILGCRLSASDNLPKERPQRERLGPPRKHSEAHRTPRVVVNDNGQPPTERPALRQSEG